jgi:hypothetical protein
MWIPPAKAIVRIFNNGPEFIFLILTIWEYLKAQAVNQSVLGWK